MKRKNQTEVSRRHWPELREWANFAVAATALIVSVVSLWMTAQISGLEDYLRSEIARRNTELNSLSDRTKEAEALAQVREGQLAQLDASISEVVASSLTAQSQLIDAQGTLSSIRADSQAAKGDLARTRVEQENLVTNLANREKTFELFGRRQAYQSYVINIMFSAFLFDSSEEDPSGASVLQRIMSQSPDRGAELLAPYFEDVRDNFNRVCPTYHTRVITLPQPTSRPDTPTIRYLSNASQGEIDRMTREAQEQYSRDLKTHRESILANRNAFRDAAEILSDEAGDCVCRALSTAVVSAAQICPDAALETIRREMRRASDER